MLFRLNCVLLSLLISAGARADSEAPFDYFEPQRQLIRNGVQAVLTCNGLFTSRRTIEQVFRQELAFLPNPVGSASGGNYRVDRERRAVSVGGGEDGLAITAAFREGLACVVMAPDQTMDNIAKLPQLTAAPLPGDPAKIPWPMGDAATIAVPPSVNEKALRAASDWAFDRDTAEQDTLSLLVLHKGNIIHERYASGVDMHTRTRTWSTAKSIAATLIGILVDQGKLSLDASLNIDWLPELLNPEQDPRHHITLRHTLNMASGLYPVDSFKMEYATGSGLAYWAGSSSVEGARNRGLVREPGSFWDYENYDTLLAVYAMKKALGSEAAYHSFPVRLCSTNWACATPCSAPTVLAISFSLARYTPTLATWRVLGCCINKAAFGRVSALFQRIGLSLFAPPHRLARRTSISMAGSGGWCPPIARMCLPMPMPPQAIAVSMSSWYRLMS